MVDLLNRLFNGKSLHRLNLQLESFACAMWSFFSDTIILLASLMNNLLYSSDFPNLVIGIGKLIRMNRFYNSL